MKAEVFFLDLYSVHSHYSVPELTEGTRFHVAKPEPPLSLFSLVPVEVDRPCDEYVCDYVLALAYVIVGWVRQSQWQWSQSRKRSRLYKCIHSREVYAYRGPAAVLSGISPSFEASSLLFLVLSALSGVQWVAV